MARHCGMRVAAMSVVVNLASGLTKEHITHEDTLKYSAQAAGNLKKIVTDFIASHSKWTEA